VTLTFLKGTRVGGIKWLSSLHPIDVSPLQKNRGKSLKVGYAALKTVFIALLIH
jgi:hypothetical protein